MDEKKITSAIRILKLAEQQANLYGEPVEIAYSGGKDSDVILQLAKESGINYRAIYKQTTIDPPGTMEHVKTNGVEIRRPKENSLSGVYSTAPKAPISTASNLGALGMPSNRTHQLLESVLVAKLFDVCEELDMSVMSEGKNKDGEIDSRVADVLIVNDDGDAVVVIEICAKETANEAVKRIKEFFDTNPGTMKEAFVYNFTSDKWDYYKDNRKQSPNTLCKTVNRDLRLIVENSKVYKERIKQR